MKKRVSRSLAAVLCLVMALSMLSPALAAVPMMGEQAGVEEVSPEDVGTMAHSHGEVVEQRPAVDDTQADAPAALLDEGWTHNFTTSGKDSSFYSITGTLSTSKGTVTYNGLTLTQCLKMESSTNITFTAPADGTLTLVFVEDAPTIKLDGAKHTGAKGVMTLDVAAGEHTLTKADSHNLFYMVYARKEAAAHDPVWDEGTVTKEPTCTETGVKTFRCTVSGCVDASHVKTETVAKLDHAYENGGVYCTMCGVNKNDPSDVHKTHTFGDWVTDKAATCTEEGSRHRTCTNAKCNKVETEVLPKSDHSYNDQGVCSVCGAPMGAVVGGWFEALYAEMADVTPDQVTAVSWTGASTGSLDAEGLKYLVRSAAVKKNGADVSGTRIDVPGLKPGSYDLTITMGSSSFVSKNITVLAHDRSGFAHYKYTDGVGAYNDDGTLKSNAVVLYVTDANKNDVSLTVGSTTVKGIGNILNTKGYKDNGNNGILKKLADAGKPLVVRVVGKVTAPEGVTAYASTAYGGSDTDNGFMCRMQDANNVTIEGIGADATVDGWGFHFMAGTKGYGRSFELRNITFRNVPEDCVGMEGTQEGSTLSAPVERCWIHNCEF